MSVALRRQRDGKLRRYWYGEYREADGKRKVLNLGEWRGTPPPSLLGTGEETTGDAAFEASRKRAEDALQRHADEAHRKGRAEHLTERLIESKTGRAVEYVRIDELPERWRNLGRAKAPAKRYLKVCDAHFSRFIEFMKEQNPPATYLYEVTPEDASAYAVHCRDTLANATASDTIRLAAKAMDRFLPVGARNPFAEIKLGRSEGETIHRQPFSPEELEAIVATANGDDFMGALITAAACTGMRRGDVCRLRWSDVDLDGGMLAVKTSKTGATVEIPIFAPLRAVLERLGGKRGQYVFPEAAKMLAQNPQGLSYRFKAIVAKALDASTSKPAPDIHRAADIEAEALDAIDANTSEGERRDRIADTFRRYAAGASVRDIQKAVGCARSTVSADLAAVEDWAGKRFVRRRPGRHTKGSRNGVKDAIARVTRAKREHGQRAASVRDWHALRTTFVTLALSAGVPIELVRRVTGHATVDVVLRHYFRPDREQFRAALTNAMPGILTGGKQKRLPPAEELVAIAGKVAAGTATEKDKKRLRVLAAKV